VLELRLEKDKIVIVSKELACKQIVSIITRKFACGLTSFYIIDLPASHFTDLENATKLAAGRNRRILIYCAVKWQMTADDSMWRLLFSRF
jgi:hypothetical protein